MTAHDVILALRNLTFIVVFGVIPMIAWMRNRGRR